MDFSLNGVDFVMLQKNFEEAANNYKLNFFGANLQGTTLSGICLMNADFRFANLYKANLAGADLSYVDLSQAILDGIKIDRAKFLGELLLYEANFSWGQLSPANLFGSYMYNFDFNCLDEFNKEKLISKGVIVCYVGDYVKIKATHKFKNDEFYITANIDLQKTKEFNQDYWEITQI